jgi:hypothetical protein
VDYLVDRFAIVWCAIIFGSTFGCLSTSAARSFGRWGSWNWGAGQIILSSGYYSGISVDLVNPTRDSASANYVTHNRFKMISNALERMALLA